MNQIERIMHMEKILNDGTEAVNNLQKALLNYLKVKEQIEELSDYYGSKIWFQDYEDERNDKLPKDLNRGVLSEDGINTLLIDDFELQQMIKAIQIQNINEQ
ncbi:DUF4298 domain-containing protein [Phocicoccus pinnipedialis]|uniref:DUF4298 domain-containing protein n=1 Tax=Phocicoccus pinnipedialis TaxID=110845 RepID=A0A6V7R4R4_9BACL|nr:DUF4298 domain-containing protein [Jeotgalicoccus pinnipedialis]MBP1939694.1 DNA topoisomerase IB [Jeotgalicoccus pinnipedialis]CAD2072316.1 hypothetical protein JEOPIN946_00414 [Jeotgalicoccus pinnipedialis]